MPAQLLARSEGPNILLDKPILLLGRHLECDIQLNSRKISRRHCCIAQVNDYLIIRDLGSTNGVRVNGERVIEGKLAKGDEVTIGNFKYEVTFDSFPIPKVDSQKPLTCVGRINDEYLENAEEPIPLDEPVSTNKVLPAQPVMPQRPQSAASGNSEKEHRPQSSFILPDNLSLLPQSGAFPNPKSNDTSR